MDVLFLSQGARPPNLSVCYECCSIIKINLHMAMHAAWSGAMDIYIWILGLRKNIFVQSQVGFLQN